MLVVHGTALFRSRVPGTPPGDGDESSTVLGPWYANVLRWRSPVVVLVNRDTFVPVLAPLAPARTLLRRLPQAIGDLLAELGVPAGTIEAEQAAMAEVRVAPTADRSVVGVMNDYLQWIEWMRDDVADLTELALRLAERPVGPLMRRGLAGSAPVDELRAVLAERAPHAPMPSRPRRRRTAPPAPQERIAMRTPDGRTIEVRHQPGLADELLRELAPLLAADGIDLASPPDRATFEAALGRAVERRNTELFTPIGARRIAARGALTTAAGLLNDGRGDLAARLLANVVPESADARVPEVPAVIGMALGLLDDWLGGHAAVAPAGLAREVRLPPGHLAGRPAALELLALAAQGRAFSSLGTALTTYGGQAVLAGAALALTAAAQAWVRRTGGPLTMLLVEQVR